MFSAVELNSPGISSGSMSLPLPSLPSLSAGGIAPK
jgi:hypothetical protein